MIEERSTCSLLIMFIGTANLLHFEIMILTEFNGPSFHILNGSGVINLKKNLISVKEIARWWMEVFHLYIIY